MQEHNKAWWNKNVLRWRLKVSADCIRRRCDGSLFHFHARGPAVPKERRSPNDDSVRGTAVRRSSTQLISDQLWHALAAADGMMRSTNYRTVRHGIQTIMNNRTQLVLDIRRKGDTDGPRKKLLDFGGSNKYHVTLGVRVSIRGSVAEGGVDVT